MIRFRGRVFSGVSMIMFACLLLFGAARAQDFTQETNEQHDARMQWWREARFGLFIHWGLYSIPAGEWKGKTEHGEWIRTTAQIPLEDYDSFVHQFNPVRFDAAAWVKAAKGAGMKYIVITTKHHDGFCLFDSKYTDFDVMSTPFKRDIMKELSDACRAEGMTICWYHSIMDWHHPDYLPRREWEQARTTAGADFDRYRRYLKNQVQELITAYGPIGVLWFDGEWESTWTTAYGRDLYNYVRSLQPSIIINNRVTAGRSGMAGFTKSGEFAGDFGTPEQEIPATGLPGVDWESCMTMNGHWGYNSRDLNFKSGGELIRKLADIASKGGNFLLNVGPTAEGVIPPISIERLREIGAWMNVNGEAIHGTAASPFERLDWGCCTQKAVAGGTRLYLHVTRWPADRQLVVPGILNTPRQAELLADAAKTPLPIRREDDALIISVPPSAPDSINTVIALDIDGRPDITNPPAIAAPFSVFTDTLEVVLTTARENVEIRYTCDGSVPTAGSALVSGPVRITETTTLSARCFRKGKAVSTTAAASYKKVKARPAVGNIQVEPGVRYARYEGTWDRAPDLRTLVPAERGVAATIDINAALEKRKEYFGIEYSGFILIPETGVCRFFTDSDDGSRLYIDDTLVVDNDGLHGLIEKDGEIALAAGLHSIRVDYLQKTGGAGLKVSLMSSSIEKRAVPEDMLLH